MLRFLTLFLGSIGLILGSACAQLTWTRISRNAPVVGVSELDVGQANLTECLERFGAPLWVLELEDGGGAVLAYAWLEEKSWGLRVSVPLSDYASVDFDYDKLDARTRGALLFFDEDWTLTAWREGFLADLAANLQRRRPVSLDES